MMINSLSWRWYDETQRSYIQLQSAVQLLDYLAGLYSWELPAGTSYAPSAVRRLTIALERELRLYVGEIAPDLLPPLREVRGESHGSRPRGSKASEPPPAAGRRGGEAAKTGG